MDIWQHDAKWAWEKARSEGGFSWACWDAVLEGVDWVVRDGNQKEVMRTHIEPLAKLIAKLPELLEPDLRSTVLFVKAAGGGNKPIPDVAAIGTMTVQEAYNKGYGEGWEHGAADMERSIDDESPQRYGDGDLGDPMADNVDQPHGGGR